MQLTCSVLQVYGNDRSTEVIYLDKTPKHWKTVATLFRGVE